MRTFAVGAALGAAVVGTAALVLTRGGSTRSPADVAKSAQAATRPVFDADPDADSLREQLAALRAENARLQAANARREVRTQPTQNPAPEVAEASAPVGTAEGFLLGELRQMLDSGALEQRFRDDPESLREFLLETWTLLDQPERALEILRRSDGDPMAAAYAQMIAQQLWERGQPGLAAEACRIALLDSPEDFYLLAEFAQRAPAEALAALDQLEAFNTDGDFRAQRAIVLLQAGRRDEALALFDALSADGLVPEMAWEQLLMVDPAAAAERLRRRIASGAGDSETRYQLARSLRAVGDDAGATTETLGMLEQNPDNGAALEMLSEIDPARALSWIEDQMARGRGDAMWGSYGRSLELNHRPQDALAAYWRAFEVSPDWEVSSRLLALDPISVSVRLTAAAEATQDDELFGDVADALWRAGRRADAERLWRRALQIDPSDSEWIGKVQAVDAGRDPLE